MTSSEKFLCDYLKVSEQDLPELLINSKLFSEVMEAYGAELERRKADATPKQLVYAPTYSNCANNQHAWMYDYSGTTSREKCVICGEIRIVANPCFTNEQQKPYEIPHQITSIPISEVVLTGGQSILLNPVKRLYWDWKNNCWDESKRKWKIGTLDNETEIRNL